MAISKIGGTGSDNWELISSVTPTAASAAVNFTGLSVYRKFAIRTTGAVFGTTGSLSIRLNNDSGTNYGFSYNLASASAGVNIAYASAGQTAFAFSSGGTNHSQFLIIENCDNTGLKIVTSGFHIATNNSIDYFGYYVASAVVSQVNVITSTTFTAAGTIALYGVK